MYNRLFNSSTVQFAVAFALSLGALMLIFTPENLHFKWAVNYTVQAMLGYFALGFLFLAARQNKLMFVSFACCGALCIFLKERSVENPFYTSVPEKTLSSISIAHFNIRNSGEYISETIETIKNTDADLISIQETDMTWFGELSDCLQDKYQYLVALPDTGFYGLAVFSKYQLLSADTFHFNNKPNLLCKFETPEQDLFLLSAHTSPANNTDSYNKLTDHLDMLSAKIRKIDAPLVTLGDYNAVSWSNEIYKFKNTTGLKSSRKGASPAFPNGEINLMDVPFDHLFFSDHLECVDFKTLHDKESHHLGIIGVYQFKPTPLTLNVTRKD